METSDTMADPPAHQEFLLAVTELRSNQAHDRERWNAEMVRVIDAARHDSNAAVSVSFTEAVLSQPFLLQSLSALEIVNQKLVSKAWAAWFDNNITAIANARRQDDSRDWYFPVIALLDWRTPTSLSLFGIWHATADQSSGRLLHKCPTLDYLPPQPPGCRQPQYNITASSHGLLLVKAHSFSLMAPDNKPRGKASRTCDRCVAVLDRKNLDWESLTMINPLTKQFRVLPAFDRTGGFQGWTTMHCHGAQAQIMVDDEANSYRVLYYKCWWDMVYVYESKFDSWQLVNHNHTPLHPELGARQDGLNYCTSAWLRGRLHFADIREVTATEMQRFPMFELGGVVRLFEIDIETGHWRQFKDFLLCKCPVPLQDLGVIPFFGFEKNVLSNLELVECMGHIFAVIPTRIDESLQPLHSWRPGMLWNDITTLDFTYIMALQFYIFQLEGEDLHCGVLRIELPRDSNSCKDTRQLSLYAKTWIRETNLMDPGPNWFSCTAKGSVIWVSCEDYLLQYDVESGLSKTQLLPKREMQRCDLQKEIGIQAQLPHEALARQTVLAALQGLAVVKNAGIKLSNTSFVFCVR